MDVKTCIETRRSIRGYTAEPVTREQIREVIRAAQMAPSWANSQVSRYYVADGEHAKAIFDRLPGFNQNNTKNVPVFIVTTVVKGRSGYRRDGAPATHLGHGFECFDNGLQVQNLCLRAHVLGLGTLIMGAYDEPPIREYFNIPETEAIVCVLSLGHPNGEPSGTNQRLDIDEVLTFKE